MRYRTGAAADAAELRLTLLDALGQLSPRGRAIIVLRYWEDHSIPGRLRHGPAPEYGTAVVALAAVALAGLVHRPPKPSTAGSSGRESAYLPWVELGNGHHTPRRRLATRPSQLSQCICYQ